LARAERTVTLVCAAITGAGSGLCRPVNRGAGITARSAANEDVRSGRRSYMTMQEERRVSTRCSSTCPVLALGHRAASHPPGHAVPAMDAQTGDRRRDRDKPGSVAAVFTAW
jgi:hypothetical protein